MLARSLLIWRTIRLAKAALLRTLAVALTLLVTTLGALTVVIAGLIAPFALRTLTVIITWLITALRTLTIVIAGLITTFTLRTLTIALAGLIATLTGLIAALLTVLTLLVATAEVITRTIAATLGCTALQTCPKTLGTEAALFIVVVTITGTLEIRALSCMDTGTRRASRL